MSNARSEPEIQPTAAPGPTGATKARRLAEPDVPVRTLLLEAAIRLFCRHGIHATGIDAIITEAGVARMTVYNQFGSKEGLIAAALEHEGAAWRAWFFTRLAGIQGGARERLLGIFDVLEEWFSREDYFGCALMNAITEYRNQDEKIRSVTYAHKARVLEQIRALAVASGAPDPDALTGQIDLLMDGAIVKSLIKKSPVAAREAKAIAAALLSPPTRTMLADGDKP